MWTLVPSGSKVMYSLLGHLGLETGATECPKAPEFRRAVKAYLPGSWPSEGAWGLCTHHLAGSVLCSAFSQWQLERLARLRPLFSLREQLVFPIPALSLLQRILSEEGLAGPGWP